MSNHCRLTCGSTTGATQEEAAPNELETGLDHAEWFWWNRNMNTIKGVGSEPIFVDKVGTVWLCHGRSLTRCVPRQIRDCTEREIDSVTFQDKVHERLPRNPEELSAWLKGTKNHYRYLTLECVPEIDAEGELVSLPSQPADGTGLGRPLFIEGPCAAAPDNESTTVTVEDWTNNPQP